MALPLPTFASLRAFEAVGRLGGIRRGAQGLGVSHAIVSRHVRGLEETLSATLLDRDSGRMTAIGVDFHCRLSKVFDDLADATDAVRGRADGKLIISCVPGFALHWLAPRVATASGRTNMPAVDLRSQEGVPELSKNVADGDIRYVSDTEKRIDGRAVRTLVLARPHVFPVAAPSVMASCRDALKAADDLVHLPLIEEDTNAEWASWLAHQGVNAVLKRPVGRYGHAHLALTAARAGQGVALTNRFLAAEDLASGRLVRVAPAIGDFTPVSLGAYVFKAPAGRWSDHSVARFRRWLVAEIRADAEE